MSADRSELDARVLAWMREPYWTPDEQRFSALAQDIFAFQFENCPAYARFCEASNLSPAKLRDWREIPAVPTGAFKETALRSFPAEATRKTFRTSGTSSERRGELHLDTLELYEASLLPTLRHFVFPKLGANQKIAIRVLAPSPEEAPDSSLSHMFGQAIDHFGSPDSGYDLRGSELDRDGLTGVLEDLCRAGEAVALCGTAFAFVHWIDETAGKRIELPAGSRILETGGFKGRSRVVTREELHGSLSESFGVPRERILNQYGMTELGSQFYDSSLAAPGEARRKLGPPWTRLRIVDPTTGNDVAAGETGMIVIHDLANTGSIAAIQTADLGVRQGDGFEVEGRDPGAEQRGCSIATDTMLEASRESRA